MSLTSAQRPHLAELIACPPPGSKVAEAKEFGIDLTLLLENLGRTPKQRAKNLFSSIRFLHQMRAAGERHRSKR